MVIKIEECVDQSFTNLKSITYSEYQYLDLLVELFENDGWRVKRDASIADRGADLAVSRGELKYMVALKISSEGRRDRLVPLVSQAILQARAAARASNEQPIPLAVVAAPVIPRNAADGIKSFLEKFAPDAAVGIFDRDGFRRFIGPGLEDLAATPNRSARKEKLKVPDSANLFSDLNQWLLKVLLAPMIPEELLQAPRESYRNAAELATAARVSMMSSFRFVRQLDQERFLDRDSESLQLVRRQDLMSRWRAAHLRPGRELPLCWENSVKNEHLLPAALRAYIGDSSSSERPGRRACLGLFTAAESLGFEPVHGIPPTFYLEHLDRAALGRIGLTPLGAEYRPDVKVRVPIFRESIFRAAVMRDGLPVTDILQVWLDVSSYPTNGQARAEEICRRDLMPIFTETSI
jgi:hypothetical protein